MSHFYGTLQGTRGRATRCGTKSSGITAQAASWAGATANNIQQDYMSVDFYGATYWIRA